jgi:hypothetical protein
MGKWTASLVTLFKVVFWVVAIYVIFFMTLKYLFH